MGIAAAVSLAKYVVFVDMLGVSHAWDFQMADFWLHSFLQTPKRT